MVSVALAPGESTSSLVHRFTAWREAHGECQMPAQTPASEAQTAPDADQVSDATNGGQGAVSGL